MSIHIYKGHVIEITTLERCSETQYAGDVYHNGDLVNSQVDITDAGVLSMCIYYIDNLGDDKDE